TARATQLIRPAPGAEAAACRRCGGADRRVPVGADFDATPELIRQIEVDQAVLLGEADRDRALRTIELGLRLQHLEGCVQRGRARRQSWRAALTGSMPASFHQAASSPTRCTNR